MIYWIALHCQITVNFILNSIPMVTILVLFTLLQYATHGLSFFISSVMSPTEPSTIISTSSGIVSFNFPPVAVTLLVEASPSSFGLFGVGSSTHLNPLHIGLPLHFMKRQPLLRSFVLQKSLIFSPQPLTQSKSTQGQWFLQWPTSPHSKQPFNLAITCWTRKNRELHNLENFD